MKKLKLYLDATNAAASAVGKKPDEVKAIQEKAWADGGLETKQDRDMFDYMWNDALGVCNALSKQQLPSESASVKHGS